MSALSTPPPPPPPKIKEDLCNIGQFMSLQSRVGGILILIATL